MQCRVVGHTIRGDGVKVLELYDPATKTHHEWPVGSFDTPIGAMVEYSDREEYREGWDHYDDERYVG